ncbi:hypothetical protein RHSIM_Rhsim01G0209700 [Rhododendron simsii]|uniref:Uncharacterized protein n=1 Tax=Rhododendron simsii TaxID=118357 RepID=A0A834LW55_RHOSS|nr:hypothetical protein RHSIM_Rhsim01G0209700 [Rhododendron simsii]
MLLPVWPGLNFWYYLGIISSPSWFFSFLAMDFFKKTTGLVSVFLISTLIVLWSAGNCVLSKLFFSLQRNPEADRFFRGYEGAGKTVGFALLFFGNVGLYYFSEKSIACMLTFLFLAVYCLCTLFCIQPYTDFGTQEFLLSASLNQTLTLFGLRSLYSWLVIIACVVIAGIRYCLEPVHPSGSGLEATNDEVHELESGQLLPIHTNNEEDTPDSLGAQLDINNPSPFESFLELALAGSTSPLSEGDFNIGRRKKKVLESLVKSRFGVHSEELVPLSLNFDQSFPFETSQITCPL